MKPFDVMDPAIDPFKSRMIEASAGTGKTFTIEHLYLRLLTDPRLLGDVSRLLIVTFTKAATRELKMRLKGALRAAIDGAFLPYLKAGDKGRLKKALVTFDEAQIFTLHGFCYEMLKGYPIEANLIPLEEEEGDLSKKEKIEVIKDYFRFGLKGFSKGQLEGVFRWARNETDLLAKAILREVERRGNLICPRTFKEVVAEVTLPSPIKCDRLLEIARNYQGLSNRQGELKLEVIEGIRQFAKDLEAPFSETLLDRWIQEGNPFLEKVVMGQLKAKKERGEVEEAFFPLAQLLEEIKNPLNALAKMAYDVRAMFEERLNRAERLTFDRMLEAMEKATKQASFAEKVGGAFDVAIVDEFQDTDPLQWNILQRLFSKRKLILVGDPKQSIYAFRSADIYCYLDAVDTLGKEACFSLDTNYRSRPALVKQLNILFSPNLIEDPIPLPERQGAIECPPVKAGIAEDHPLSSTGAIQFMIGKEEGELLLFIGQEVSTLKKEYILPYSHFAILVHDRYQAARVSSHLAERGIPTRLVRGTPPVEHPLFWPLYQVTCAAINPDDPVAFRTALASPLIGLPSDLWEEEAYLKMEKLHYVLNSKGFFPFFEALMNTDWDGITSHERMLAEGGEGLYDFAERIADSGEEDIPSLFHRLADEGDERFALRGPSSIDAVSVLTIFASKGLEFGVVFALGLASKSGGKGRGLIAHRKGGEIFLSGSGGGGQKQMADEGDAEKMRLFYVALTRAKDRVYVPFLLDKTESSTSPIELYLSKLRKRENVKRLDILKNEGMVIREVEKIDVQSVGRADLLSPPKKLGSYSPSLPYSLQSFSGLASHRGRSFQVEAFEEKSLQSLPAGAETGILVHELLEKADLCRESSIKNLVPWVKKVAQGRLVGWEEVLAEMVHLAFKAFPLEGVSPNRMLREIDLLYPTEKTSLYHHPIAPGLITGIVDLLFEREGSFYLLDWKSNRLADYEPETLAMEMVSCDYLTQATLYAEGANRYLKRIGAPPLAGCYYLFLRGLKTRSCGAFFIEPKELFWK